MWYKVNDKNKNRSSASMDNLHPVEAAIVAEWEALKTRNPADSVAMQPVEKEEVKMEQGGGEAGDQGRGGTGV